MSKLIEWFTESPVAANLLMMMILLGGTVSYVAQVNRQFFPSIGSSTVSVDVNYLGAGPAEVEDRILIRVEEAVQDLEGVKQITSVATEGSARIYIKVENGYDTRVLLDDVKARVDSINTFPQESERPVVSEYSAQDQREMFLAVSGNMDERTLKIWAERIRDDIAALDNIDKVELNGVRPYEVAIEVPEVNLRRYGLTLEDVQRAVATNSLNLPAGKIKSAQGDITLRTRGQAYNKADFEEIVVLQADDGTVIRVKDVATVIDGFTEDDFRARLNGKRAMMMNVLSISEPDVTRTSRTVRDYLEDIATQLPDGLDISILDDASITFKDRMTMLLNNGLGGLALVLVVLMAFLRPAVAIWVAIGIAISFFGAMWALPWFGTSLNMISLFAFLLVLGIVVDDAIIVGESIHAHHERGLRGLPAASRGAARVSTPVILAVVSTLIFFAPMLAVPGGWRDAAINIPVVVFGALTFSLIESLLILPAHLKKLKPLPENPTGLLKIQQNIAESMRRFVQNRYRPMVEGALKWRGVTILGFVMAFALCAGLVGGGWIRVSFFPEIVADFVYAQIDLPENAAFSRTTALQDRLEKAALEVADEMAEEGYTPLDRILSFSNNSRVEAYAFPRTEGLGGVNAVEATKRIRERLGPIPEAEEIRFSTSIQPGDLPINIQVASPDIAELDAATRAIKAELASYDGIIDIKDTLSDPQSEITLNLRPEAQSLSLGLNDLAQQVRQNFYGAEAQRIPRGKDDVIVSVRRPRNERESVESLSETRIRVGNGLELPFDAVADVDYGVGSVMIKREDRKRANNVKADALDNVDPNQVLSQVLGDNLATWKQQFPRTEIKIDGDKKEEGEFLVSVVINLVFAFIAIYAILAICFRSYGVPFIILTAVPFGFSGAVLGHMLLGMNISMFSVLGIVAAAGVVVNDNLVLLDQLGKLRREDRMPVHQAIITAACDRFRAIILTSLTTFVGLAPLMGETSVQAQLLIPMVVSLAFGVLFSTGVTLVLVPCLYSSMWQFKQWVRRSWQDLFGGSQESSVSTPAE
ncbi:MAG: efflux RND transporter permease subunit [Pseudomonadota bacterium]